MLKICLIIASATIFIAPHAFAQVGYAPVYGNQFGTYQNSPHIYSPSGRYLGNLNDNQFDPNSVSNEFGRYGSPFSPDSINNQFGRYGSPYGVRTPYGSYR